MPELGPMMRALELQRLIEDKVSEWRERSARVAGGATVADSYQQPLNFKRHTHRRKNSSEINRIIAKYSRPNKRADEHHVTRITSESPPIRPPRGPPSRPPRTKKLSNSKIFSKSEDNLASMGDCDMHPDPDENKPRFNLAKYNAKSCEDVTAFVDIHHVRKSKNFAQTSIMNARIVDNPRPPRVKLHSICEDLTVVSDFNDSGLDLRKKSDFATSTPLSQRKTFSSEGSVFEKCNNYSKSESEMRKGRSEPDILSLSSIDSVGTSKTIDSKKKWKLGLKPPFRKGAFDCLLRWRGKKAKQVEEETVSRKR